MTEITDVQCVSCNRRPATTTTYRQPTCHLCQQRAVLIWELAFLDAHIHENVLMFCEVMLAPHPLDHVDDFMDQDREEQADV